MENVSSEHNQDANQADKNEGEARQLSRPFHVLSSPDAAEAESLAVPALPASGPRVPPLPSGPLPPLWLALT